MKEEYVLYLDESEFKNSKTFAIAGIAVKKDQIPVLEQGLYEIKKIIWSEDYINNNDPVIHCTELQNIYNKRNNMEQVNEEYQELVKLSADEIEKIYFQVYGKLCQILKRSNATVFSCVIKIQQLFDLFYLDESHNGLHLIDDKYNIALQNIIENYTHYLSVCDGFGDVVYESRNSPGENSVKSPDIKLINDYHKIQANNKGIVYTNNNAIQSRNRTIVAYSKKENIAGLQIADFVAYNSIKYENCKVEEQITDFMKQIHKLSYNGGHKVSEIDQRSFWGMRVLPSFLRMDDLIKTNKTLKNAYDNLKKERNRQNKKIKEYEDKIKELETEVKQLKKDLEDLRNNKKSIDINSNN